MPESGIRITKDDRRVLQRMIRETPGKIDDLARATSQGIAADIRQSFGTSPPGREYRRGGRVHVASQAGFPPNIDTNALRESIRAAKIAAMKYRVMDGVEYGINLEQGTPKTAARPFVRPVFEDWRRTKFRQFGQSFGIFK